MDDLISRQGAIRIVDSIDTWQAGWRGNAIESLKAMPSAESERKAGRWIEISSLHHTYKCSECGRLLVNVTDGKNNVVKHYPYCHCGAKMEVEHETD